MLLTTTTAIAAGAVILDLMYRGYEKAVENSHENRHEIRMKLACKIMNFIKS